MISKILKTLYLFTTLIYCNNAYSTELYNVLYDIKRVRLNQYKVETEDTTNYGKLYYENSGKKFLIDENGKYFYDLKTVINHKGQSSISNFLANGNGNLIIKECDAQTGNNANSYTIESDINIPPNTNLIIPPGITLTKEDNTNRLIFSAKNGDKVCDCNILILGTISSEKSNNKKRNIFMGIINDNSDNIKIIVGPESKWIESNTDGTIYTGDKHTATFANPKFLFYPGCQLYRNTFSVENNNETIEAVGTIYLNRFITEESKDNDLLKMSVYDLVHIVYPKQNNKSFGDVQKKDDDHSYVCNPYFKNFYWRYISTVHIEGIGQKTYSFEDFEAPLYYDDNNVLSVKPNDELAPYDAKLCKECGLDSNGKYNFNYYNTPEDKDKYIDVDKAHEIFYGVDYDDNPIKIDTNTINTGLIGNKDVQLNTESDTVDILGDNSNFSGDLILPSCVTGINYGDGNSEIDNSQIKRLDKNGDIDDDFDPSSLITSYKNNSGSDNNHNNNNNPSNNDGNNNNNNNSSNNNGYNEINNGKDKIIGWDLAVLGNRIFIDFDKYRRLKYIVVTLTNSNKNKYNFSKVIVKGDNRWLNGMIITTPEIDEVEFWKWSFIKTINISGKSLCYVFKHKNLFTPFIPYNRILADRSSFINIKEVFKRHCKCKKHNCNIERSKSYKYKKYYDCIDSNEERYFYYNPKHNRRYSINEYSDKECSCSCDSCE